MRAARGRLSKSQLAMRPEPHELEALRVWLSVDQDKIRLNVAVKKNLQLARKRVIEVAPWQAFVVRQKVLGFGEISIEAEPMPTRFLSPIVAPELPGVPNTPH
jgi:hypothetical protein